MFYVIDLSKPRKAIQNKYDDIMFELKLNPPKVNKKMLIIGGIVVISLVVTSGTVYAAVNPNSIEYQYVFNHYINNLHYPKDMVVKVLNKWSEYEIKDLYVRLTGYNDGVNTINAVVNLGKGTVSVCGKALNVVCKGIDYLILK